MGFPKAMFSHDRCAARQSRLPDLVRSLQDEDAIECCHLTCLPVAGVELPLRAIIRAEVIDYGSRVKGHAVFQIQVPDCREFEHSANQRA